MTLRIIFAGTPAFSASVLEALIDSEHDVVAVYSQPDRRAGRGKKMLPPPVKVVAEHAGIPVHQPLSLKDQNEQDMLRSYGADAMVVVAYGLLLPQAVLDIPAHGCLNIHASLLPRWRGAAPIERAIEAGDAETGITMMRMDAGLDTGDMLSVHRCNITDDTTGDSLRETLLPMAIEGTLQALQSIADGSVTFTPQSEEGANYASKLSKTEAAIDWRTSASQIDRQVRAFNSSNVCYSAHDNGERIKIWRGHPVNTTHTSTPGHILRADDQGIVVACGNGAYSIQQLQVPGGKPLSCRDILNARRDWFSNGRFFTLDALP
jgi:methionyl-tRNA formyltransferase